MSDTPETDAAAESNIYGVACKVDVDFARKLERERDEAREALRFIAEWGGRTLESEYGDIDCNGKWCAEQAKEAVE